MEIISIVVEAQRNFIRNRVLDQSMYYCTVRTVFRCVQYSDHVTVMCHITTTAEQNMTVQCDEELRDITTVSVTVSLSCHVQFSPQQPR